MQRHMLIFIHGGESFRSYDEYMHWLQHEYVSYMLDPWKQKEDEKSWKDHLASAFSRRIGDVYMPQMPDKKNAKYHEWKITFEAFIWQIHSRSDRITLIGNSLGGCFLMKYFSEQNSFPKEKLEAIHLVAACIEEWDFRRPENFEFLKAHPNLHIWHAEDDSIVPFSVAQELQILIPSAKYHFFPREKEYGHFSPREKIHIFSELEDTLLSGKEHRS